MQAMDVHVLEHVQRWLEQGQPVWLCTEIHTYGSSPRSPGTLLAATVGGDYVGSLSGGAVLEKTFCSALSPGSSLSPAR